MDAASIAEHSGGMYRREPLGGAEFAPETTYLNSASSGLLPRRSADALRAAIEESASHGTMGRDYLAAATASRAAFARLLDVPAERVAVGSSVAVQSAFVAASLPAGAEVLAPEGDFSSLVNPLAAHPGIKLRTVPLETLADAVRPGTALVAFSAVQSLDGRIADMTAVREAAAAHGARTYLDITQAAGWLPLRAADFDFVVAGAFKWLLCPRGTTFMAFGGEYGRGEEWPDALHAGWVAGEDVGESNYGLIQPGGHRPALRRTARPLLLRGRRAVPRPPRGAGCGGRPRPQHRARRPLSRGAGRARSDTRPAPGSAIVSTPGSRTRSTG